MRNVLNSENNTRSHRKGFTVLTSPKGKRLPFMKLGVIFTVLFVVATIFNQQLEISAKERQLNEVKEQVRVQNLVNEEMEWAVQNSDSESNYERIARSELGLVKPDERIYVFASGD